MYQQTRPAPFLSNCFQEMPDNYIYSFLEAESKGEHDPVFDRVMLPWMARQNIRAMNLSVGGERCTQVLYSDTDTLRFWDAHKKLDILNSDLEAGCSSFLLCRSKKDIQNGLAAGKILLFATLSGGRPLEGKPNLNLLSSLRSLYRLGLRGLQLTGNGRNRLADGVAETRSRGKLTQFGAQVVAECGRLGILLDTAQLSDYGFFDMLSLHEGPLLDSHSCARDCSEHPRNLSRQRLEALAKCDGVLGVSFRAALVRQEKASVTAEDLLRQIDYCVEVAGIDHVALGPDFSAFQTPVDRSIVTGFANLGPEIGPMDYRTPMQSEKYPGWIDGIWYGTRKNDFVEGLSEHESFENILPLLQQHGYSEEDCRKICGENLLRIYQDVLPN